MFCINQELVGGDICDECRQIKNCRLALAIWSTIENIIIIGEES